MLKSNVSNVTYLSVFSHSGHELPLLNMMNACKALKVLHVEWENDNKVMTAILNTALARHVKTLEKLHLDTTTSLDADPICNLEILTSLTHLHIDAVLLDCDTDSDFRGSMPQLPCSLTHLKILGAALRGFSEILTRILSQLHAGLLKLAIQFFALDSDELAPLDCITYLHTSSDSFDAQFKNNSDWVLAFAPKCGQDVAFNSRKGEQTIQETVSYMLAKINEDGLLALLTDYYSDWPTQDALTTSAVEKVRRRIRKDVLNH